MKSLCALSHCSSPITVVGVLVFPLSILTPCKTNPICFLGLRFGAMLTNTLQVSRDSTSLAAKVRSLRCVGMCNVWVNIHLPREGLALGFRPAEPLGEKTMRKHQINVPPSFSISLLFHVHKKEVWDVALFHCIFSQHFTRSVEMLPLLHSQWHLSKCCFFYINNGIYRSTIKC